MEFKLVEGEKEISRVEHESMKLVLTESRLVQVVDEGILFKGLLSIELDSLDSVGRGTKRSLGLFLVGLILLAGSLAFIGLTSITGIVVAAVGLLLCVGFWFYKTYTLDFKSLREEMKIQASELGEDKIDAFLDEVMKAKIKLLRR